MMQEAKMSKLTQISKKKSQNLRQIFKVHIPFRQLVSKNFFVVINPSQYVAHPNAAVATRAPACVIVSSYTYRWEGTVSKSIKGKCRVCVCQPEADEHNNSDPSIAGRRSCVHIMCIVKSACLLCMYVSMLPWRVYQFCLPYMGIPKLIH